MLGYALTGYNDFAIEHVAFYRKLRSRLGSVEGRMTLDIGCGKSYWLTLLLASDGANAVGVDTEEVRRGRSPGKYLDMCRRNGFERMLKTATWDLIFSPLYDRALSRHYGSRLRHDLVDLRPYDGVNLGFEDDAFDFVVSHEVFEHVEDVDRLCRSIARVLKPDGLAYIYIHSWTSISGGHHIAWKHPDSRPSRVVPPWSHLREGKQWPVPSWLNKYREHDYRTCFEKHFEIIEWVDGAEEGRQLLSDSLRAELGEYSEHELLTKGFTVIAIPLRSTPGEQDR